MRLLQVKYLLVDHEKPYRAARAKSILTMISEVIVGRLKISAYLFYTYM